MTLPITRVQLLAEVEELIQTHDYGRGELAEMQRPALHAVQFLLDKLIKLLKTHGPLCPVCGAPLVKGQATVTSPIKANCYTCSTPGCYCLVLMPDKSAKAAMEMSCDES